MKFGSRRHFGAALAILTIAALTGCSAAGGSSSGGGSSSSVGSSSGGSSSSGGDTKTSTKAVSIALSNGFVNGWRLTLINKFEATAEQLKKQGVVSSYSVVNAPGDNSATAQASQIRSLMLKKPDVLIVIPASSTALVPVVNAACAAKITVLVLDADMNAPCATIVRNDYSQWGADSVQPAIDAIHEKGTIVLNRGVIGSQPEEAFYARAKDVLAKYPNVKVAATVNGFCDVATTQKEIVGVLGSLGQIDAVPGCIGGMGIVQAFKAANRPIPVVNFDTDGKSLSFWKSSGIDNGSYSVLTDPGLGLAAIYVALDELNGKKVPHTVLTPTIQISKDKLGYWVSKLKPDEYASYPWTQTSVDAAIEQLNAGKPAVAPSLS